MDLEQMAGRALENPGLVRGYVAFMLGFMGRGIAAAGEVDPAVRAEVAGFPADFSFEMRVQPEGPGLALRKTERNGFELAPDLEGRPTLSIQFKHLRHAWRVLTFQESTAQAFANDRMIVDGEIAYAMRMVRILNRFQALALPPAIAKRALKRIPDIPSDERREVTAKLFGRLALSAILP